MDKVEAQYALESTSQPLGISSYELSKLIPEEFKGSLLQLKRLRQNWKIKILAKETSKYIFNDAEENELNWQILVLNG